MKGETLDKFAYYIIMYILLYRMQCVSNISRMQVKLINSPHMRLYTSVLANASAT